MSTLRQRSWVWGYMLEQPAPAPVPFVGNSWCGLQTAACYLDVPNVVFMNSNHDQKALRPELLDPLCDCERVVCGLQHGAYAETARRVSELSQQYGNISGGLIDDFHDFHGPSRDMTPEQTREVYEALHSANPELRLYVVRYTWQDQAELEGHLPYFDVINLWVWVANTYDWQVRLQPELERLHHETGKPILLGLFLHDYGGTGQAVAQDILELQTQRAVAFARTGLIEGFVLLQSGWFGQETHRPQVQWVKQYLQWAFGTTEACQELDC